MNRKLVMISFLASMLVATMMILPSYAQATQGLGYTANSADKTSIVASAVRGQDSHVEFTVFNQGSSDLNCDVFVNSSYSWWITFDQASFVLASGDHKVVKMNIGAPYNGSNRNDFTVYLRGAPTGSGGTPVQLGWEIKAEVTLSGPTAPPNDNPNGSNPTDTPPGNIPVEWIVLPAVIIVGIAGYVVYRMRFKGGAEK
jgi:hypothetical protein